MKCDICGEREAVIFIQQVNERVSKELHLCAECAAAKGFSADGGQLRVPLAGIFSDLIGGSAKDAQVKTCSVCGLSFDDIKKNKCAGCAECYHTFNSEIQMVMHSAGMPVEYTGSKPRQLAGFRPILVEREILKRELQQAIEREDYETAARCRDSLHELQGDNTNVGN